MLSQRIIRFLLSIAISALTLMAQTGSGTIQGVVKDASSAVVAGATVNITHTETMRTYSTKTNDVGLFVFPPVQPGSYEIKAEMAGMQTWSAKFLLAVGQTVDLSPILGVGSISTQITVASEAAPLVTTSDSTISRNLERQRIEQLPTDGRSIANIAMMASPGLFNGQDGGVNPINTGLRDGVELYQDGAVIKNRDVGDWSGRLPGVDSVEELRVETSMSSAQFNRPGSVILSTKSGTNTVHGSAFETNRNSGMGVARRRQDFYTKPPHYVRNEFGLSLGGPVFIPKVYNGKNKTFFFVSYEALRQRSASTSSTTVQTDAMRNGDYSGMVDAQGRQTTIYDPLSTGAAPNWARTPFPGNIIPQARESSNAKYIFSVMPKPTFPNVNPNIDSNWFGLLPSMTSDYTVTSRIDQRLSDKDQLFGRVSVGHDNAPYVQNGIIALSGPLNWVTGTYHDVSATGTLSHTFSPSLLSSTRVSYSHEFKFVGSPDDPQIGNMATFLGMPNLGNDPFNSYSTSGTGFGANYSTQQVRYNTTRILLANEDFTKVLGSHQLQFGGELHLEFLNSLTDHNGTGITYDALATSLYDPTSGSSYSAVPFTGASAASFYLGYVGTFKDTVKRPAWDLRDKIFGGYIQDNWKVTSRLTLNLGLRYQNMPAESISGNYAVGFDQKTDSMVFARSLQDMYAAKMTSPTIMNGLTAIGAKVITAQQAGLPAGLVYGNPWIFEPRLGFAYRMGSSSKPLVLRGGWGVYDSQAALRTWDNLAGSGIPYGYPVQYAVSNAALVGKIPYQDGLPNYELRSVPQFQAGVNTSTVLNDPNYVSITPGCCALQYNNPNLHPTRSMQWNFSIGREAIHGIVVNASYVGTHGWNIPQNVNINAAPNDYVWYTNTGLPKATGVYSGTGQNAFDTTTYGTISEYITRGYSNANSIIVEAQRRYSHGVGFQFDYVMTNPFTESTLVGNGGGAGVGPVSTFLQGTVPTDFDARNRFLNYQRDTAIPHHQFKWNWVVDLPFGRNHLIGGNAGKALNAVIGGWQVAGTGTYQSRYFTLPTSNWGPTSDVQTYGTQYPIQDCTSGQCRPGYLYWNGYITPTVINRVDASGKCTGICGIPSNYTPSNQPLIPWGQTALPANAPAGTNMQQYWETSTVWVKLTNGSVVRTTLNTGLNAWMNQYAPAPWTFNLSGSLFKQFDLSERLRLRLNADFFQVLNNPGLPGPGSNGILSTTNSQNSPRVLQLTLRLTW